MKKLFYKITAIIVLFAQIVTSVPGQAAAHTTPVHIPPVFNAIDPLHWTMPTTLGSVELRRKGPAGKTLILIEDAHAVSEAQSNILNILKRMPANEGASAVLLEGVTAQPDLEIFKAFPDQPWLEKFLRKAIDNNDLAGSAASAMLSSGHLEYFQTENRDDYFETLKSYLAALPYQKIIQSDLALQRKELDLKKQQCYTPSALEVDALREKSLQIFSDSKALGRLFQITSTLNSDAAPYLNRLRKVARAEKALRRPIVRHALLKVFQALDSLPLSSDEKKTIGAIRQSLQANDGFGLENVHALAQLAHRSGVVLKLTPEFQLLDWFASVFEVAQSLKGDELLEEIDRVLDARLAAALTNEEGRAIYRRNRLLQFYDRLAAFKLNVRDRAEFSPEMVLLKSNNHWKGFLDFYALQDARENYFEQALKNAFKKYANGWMVAGGFHRAGLVEIARRNGWSIVVARPAMNSFPDDGLYSKLMRGEVSWNKYFEAHHGEIDLQSAFLTHLLKKYENEKSDDAYGMLRSWRSRYISALAEKNQIPEFARFADFFHQGLAETISDRDKDRLRADWQKRLNEFSQEVESLGQSKQLNPQSFKSLLRQYSHAVPIVQMPLGFVPSDVIPAKAGRRGSKGSVPGGTDTTPEVHGATSGVGTVGVKTVLEVRSEMRKESVPIGTNPNAQRSNVRKRDNSKPRRSKIRAVYEVGPSDIARLSHSIQQYSKYKYGARQQMQMITQKMGDQLRKDSQFQHWIKEPKSIVFSTHGYSYSKTAMQFIVEALSREFKVATVIFDKASESKMSYSALQTKGARMDWYTQHPHALLGAKIEGKHVIYLDDIRNTGATEQAMLHISHENGASSFDAFYFIRLNKLPPGFEKEMNVDLIRREGGVDTIITNLNADGMVTHLLIKNFVVQYLFSLGQHELESQTAKINPKKLKIILASLAKYPNKKDYSQQIKTLEKVLRRSQMRKRNQIAVRVEQHVRSPASDLGAKKERSEARRLITPGDESDGGDDPVHNFTIFLRAGQHIANPFAGLSLKLKTGITKRAVSDALESIRQDLEPHVLLEQTVRLPAQLAPIDDIKSQLKTIIKESFVNPTPILVALSSPMSIEVAHLLPEPIRLYLLILNLQKSLGRSELREGKDALLARLISAWGLIKKKGGFVFDVSGTLRGRNGVPPEMIEALAWLIKQGIPVTLVSGVDEETLNDQILKPVFSKIWFPWFYRSKVTVYSAAGALKLKLNWLGKFKADAEYSRQYALSRYLETRLVNAIQEFFLKPDVEEFLKAHEKDYQPWLTKKLKHKKYEINDWQTPLFKASEYWKKHNLSVPALLATRDSEGKLSHALLTLLPKLAVRDLKKEMVEFVIGKLGEDAGTFDFLDANESSLHIVRKGVSKAGAVHDYLKYGRRDWSKVFYFGDDFARLPDHMGADELIARIEGWYGSTVSVGNEGRLGDSDVSYHIGGGPEELAKLILGIRDALKARSEMREIVKQVILGSIISAGLAGLKFTEIGKQFIPFIVLGIVSAAVCVIAKPFFKRTNNREKDHSISRDFEIAAKMHLKINLSKELRNNISLLKITRGDNNSVRIVKSQDLKGRNKYSVWFQYAGPLDASEEDFLTTFDDALREEGTLLQKIEFKPEDSRLAMLVIDDKEHYFKPIELLHGDDYNLVKVRTLAEAKWAVRHYPHAFAKIYSDTDLLGSFLKLIPVLFNSVRRRMLLRQILAGIDFVNWLDSYFKDEKAKIPYGEGIKDTARSEPAKNTVILHSTSFETVWRLLRRNFLERVYFPILRFPLRKILQGSLRQRIWHGLLFLTVIGGGLFKFIISPLDRILAKLFGRDQGVLEGRKRRFLFFFSKPARRVPDWVLLQPKSRSFRWFENTRHTFRLRKLVGILKSNPTIKFVDSETQQDLLSRMPEYLTILHEWIAQGGGKAMGKGAESGIEKIKWFIRQDIKEAHRRGFLTSNISANDRSASVGTPRPTRFEMRAEPKALQKALRERFETTDIRVIYFDLDGNLSDVHKPVPQAVFDMLNRLLALKRSEGTPQLKIRIVTAGSWEYAIKQVFVPHGINPDYRDRFEVASESGGYVMKQDEQGGIIVSKSVEIKPGHFGTCESLFKETISELTPDDKVISAEQDFNKGTGHTKIGFDFANTPVRDFVMQHRADLLEKFNAKLAAATASGQLPWTPHVTISNAAVDISFSAKQNYVDEDIRQLRLPLNQAMVSGDSVFPDGGDRGMFDLILQGEGTGIYSGPEIDGLPKSEHFFFNPFEGPIGTRETLDILARVYEAGFRRSEQRTETDSGDFKVQPFTNLEAHFWPSAVGTQPNMRSEFRSNRLEHFWNASQDVYVFDLGSLNGADGQMSDETAMLLAELLVEQRILHRNPRLVLFAESDLNDFKSSGDLIISKLKEALNGYLKNHDDYMDTEEKAQHILETQVEAYFSNGANRFSVYGREWRQESGAQSQGSSVGMERGLDDLFSRGFRKVTFVGNSAVPEISSIFHYEHVPPKATFETIDIKDQPVAMRQFIKNVLVRRSPTGGDVWDIGAELKADKVLKSAYSKINWSAPNYDLAVTGLLPNERKRFEELLLAALNHHLGEFVERTGRKFEGQAAWKHSKEGDIFEELRWNRFLRANEDDMDREDDFDAMVADVAVSRSEDPKQHDLIPITKPELLKHINGLLKLGLREILPRYSEGAYSTENVFGYKYFSRKWAGHRFWLFILKVDKAVSVVVIDGLIKKIFMALGVIAVFLAISYFRGPEGLAHVREGFSVSVYGKQINLLEAGIAGAIIWFFIYIRLSITKNYFDRKLRETYMELFYRSAFHTQRSEEKANLKKYEDNFNEIESKADEYSFASGEKRRSWRNSIAFVQKYLRRIGNGHQRFVYFSEIGVEAAKYMKDAGPKVILIAMIAQIHNDNPAFLEEFKQKSGKRSLRILESAIDIYEKYYKGEKLIREEAEAMVGKAATEAETNDALRKKTAELSMRARVDEWNEYAEKYVSRWEEIQDPKIQMEVVMTFLIRMRVYLAWLRRKSDAHANFHEHYRVARLARRVAVLQQLFGRIEEFKSAPLHDLIRTFESELNLQIKWLETSYSSIFISTSGPRSEPRKGSVPSEINHNSKRSEMRGVGAPVVRGPWFPPRRAGMTRHEQHLRPRVFGLGTKKERSEMREEPDQTVIDRVLEKMRQAVGQTLMSPQITLQEIIALRDIRSGGVKVVQGWIRTLSEFNVAWHTRPDQVSLLANSDLDTRMMHWVGNGYKPHVLADAYVDGLIQLMGKAFPYDPCCTAHWPWELSLSVRGGERSIQLLLGRFLQLVSTGHLDDFGKAELEVLMEAVYLARIDGDNEVTAKNAALVRMADQLPRLKGLSEWMVANPYKHENEWHSFSDHKILLRYFAGRIGSHDGGTYQNHDALIAEDKIPLLEAIRSEMRNSASAKNVWQSLGISGATIAAAAIVYWIVAIKWIHLPYTWFWLLIPLYRLVGDFVIVQIRPDGRYTWGRPIAVAIAAVSSMLFNPPYIAWLKTHQFLLQEIGSKTWADLFFLSSVSVVLPTLFFMGLYENVVRAATNGGKFAEYWKPALQKLFNRRAWKATLFEKVPAHFGEHGLMRTHVKFWAPITTSLYYAMDSLSSVMHAVVLLNLLFAIPLALYSVASKDHDALFSKTFVYIISKIYVLSFVAAIGMLCWTGQTSQIPFVSTVTLASYGLSEVFAKTAGRAIDRQFQAVSRSEMRINRNFNINDPHFGPEIRRLIEGFTPTHSGREPAQAREWLELGRRISKLYDQMISVFDTDFVLEAYRWNWRVENPELVNPTNLGRILYVRNLWFGMDDSPEGLNPGLSVAARSAGYVFHHGKWVSINLGKKTLEQYLAIFVREKLSGVVSATIENGVLKLPAAWMRDIFPWRALAFYDHPMIVIASTPNSGKTAALMTVDDRNKWLQREIRALGGHGAAASRIALKRTIHVRLNEQGEINLNPLAKLLKELEINLQNSQSGPTKVLLQGIYDEEGKFSAIRIWNPDRYSRFVAAQAARREKLEMVYDHSHARLNIVQLQKLFDSAAAEVNTGHPDRPIQIEIEGNGWRKANRDGWLDLKKVNDLDFHVSQRAPRGVELADAFDDSAVDDLVTRLAMEGVELSMPVDTTFQKNVLMWPTHLTLKIDGQTLSRKAEISYQPTWLPFDVQDAIGLLNGWQRFLTTRSFRNERDYERFVSRYLEIEFYLHDLLQRDAGNLFTTTEAAAAKVRETTRGDYRAPAEQIFLSQRFIQIGEYLSWMMTDASLLPDHDDDIWSFGWIDPARYKRLRESTKSNELISHIIKVQHDRNVALGISQRSEMRETKTVWDLIWARALEMLGLKEGEKEGLYIGVRFWRHLFPVLCTLGTIFYVFCIFVGHSIFLKYAAGGILLLVAICSAYVRVYYLTVKHFGNLKKILQSMGVKISDASLRAAVRIGNVKWSETAGIWSLEFEPRPMSGNYLRDDILKSILWFSSKPEERERAFQALREQIPAAADKQGRKWFDSQQVHYFDGALNNTLDHNRLRMLRNFWGASIPILIRREILSKGSNLAYRMELLGYNKKRSTELFISADGYLMGHYAPSFFGFLVGGLVRWVARLSICLYWGYALIGTIHEYKDLRWWEHLQGLLIVSLITFVISHMLKMFKYLSSSPTTMQIGTVTKQKKSDGKIQFEIYADGGLGAETMGRLLSAVIRNQSGQKIRRWVRDEKVQIEELGAEAHLKIDWRHLFKADSYYAWQFPLGDTRKYRITLSNEIAEFVSENPTIPNARSEMREPDQAKGRKSVGGEVDLSTLEFRGSDLGPTERSEMRIIPKKNIYFEKNGDDLKLIELQKALIRSPIVEWNQKQVLLKDKALLLQLVEGEKLHDRSGKNVAYQWVYRFFAGVSSQSDPDIVRVLNIPPDMVGAVPSGIWGQFRLIEGEVEGQPAIYIAEIQPSYGYYLLSKEQQSEYEGWREAVIEKVIKTSSDLGIHRFLAKSKKFAYAQYPGHVTSPGQKIRSITQGGAKENYGKPFREKWSEMQDGFGKVYWCREVPTNTDGSVAFDMVSVVTGNGLRRSEQRIYDWARSKDGGALITELIRALDQNFKSLLEAHFAEETGRLIAAEQNSDRAKANLRFEEGRMGLARAIQAGEIQSMAPVIYYSPAIHDQLLELIKTVQDAFGEEGKSSYRFSIIFANEDEKRNVSYALTGLTPGVARDTPVVKLSPLRGVDLYIDGAEATIQLRERIFDNKSWRYAIFGGQTLLEGSAWQRNVIRGEIPAKVAFDMVPDLIFYFAGTPTDQIEATLPLGLPAWFRYLKVERGVGLSILETALEIFAIREKTVDIAA